MGAPKGNEYYLLRSKDGRDKIFKTPEDLIKACNEYFKWCLENPLMESQVIKANQVIETETPTPTPTNNDKRKPTTIKSKTTIPYVLVEVPKMRAFTMEGLCNFIDISMRGFNLYEEREDYIPITTRIRQIIYNQKFEGAASGFLNPNIIARSLGLTDKQENIIKVEQPLFPDVYSDDSNK